MPCLAFLLLLLLASSSSPFCSGAALLGEKTPPDFGVDYFVSGTLNLPYGEISEPFKAWVSGSTKRSRIDYYGGTMKTIQRGDLDLSFKINPFTTERVLNEIDCFKIDGGDVQIMIPDLSVYTYVGEDQLAGATVDKWVYKTHKGKFVTNTYTFYSTGGDDPQPVRFDMMGYDSLIGSHYDHYFLLYEKYMPGPSDPKVFDPMGVDPKPVSACHDFPGPGLAEAHLETHSHHNPMVEYLNDDDSHIHPLFNRFVKKHAKNYTQSQDHATRKNVFKHNLRFIHSKNRAGLHYSLAVNHLADRTQSEIKLMLGLKKTPGFHGGQTYRMGETRLGAAQSRKPVPDEWDWRIQGAVTQVKDQAVCGSCWSFGTTGTIEGRIFLTTGIRVRLSQQSLVDCSWGQGNDGCDGGEDYRAYKHIQAHGIPLERDYGRYLGINGVCKPNFTEKYFIKDWVNIPSGDLEALKVALFEEGPISVGIDASHPSFAFYNQGVYYEPQCGSSEFDLDHAVLAVGYGQLHGEKYWLVKNSWSTYWGNDGYVLMSQRDNNCGVATAATYVLLKK